MELKRLVAGFTSGTSCSFFSRGATEPKADKGLSMLDGVAGLLEAAEPKLVIDPKAGVALIVTAGLAPNPAGTFGAEPKFEKEGMLPPEAAPKLPKLPNPLVLAAGGGVVLLPDKRSANELSLPGAETETNEENTDAAGDTLAAAEGVLVLAMAVTCLNDSPRRATSTL